MSNDYLTDIHDHISRQIDLCLKDQRQAHARNDRQRMAFISGKLEEFQRIRSYLSAHFDLNTQRYY